MKGLILAGGLGTRLRPLSHTGPKQLVPVANKPVLFYGIEDLVAAGIKEIGIIVGYTQKRIQHIQDAVGDGSQFGAKITLIEQDAPRGLAHAIGIAEDFMAGEDFVVYLGDNILQGGIKKFVEEFNESKSDSNILLSQVNDPKKYGVALFNENNEVIEVEEKPENPRSNYAIIGVYMFRKNIFDFIKQVKPGKKGELQITDAIAMLVNSPEHKVTSSVVSGWWDDTGNAEDILHANQMILSEIKNDIRCPVNSSVKIWGHTDIEESTILEDGVVIKGPVKIGKNCRIGPNTYIGPYTSIGDDCEIVGGEIESSILLSNVKVRFNEKIVDSLIGKHTIISSETKLPKGHRFILGENSEVKA